MEVTATPPPPLQQSNALILQVAAHLGKECQTGTCVVPEGDVEYMKRCTFQIANERDGKGIRFTFIREIEERQQSLRLSMCFRLFRRNKALRFDHHFARRTAAIFFDPYVERVLVYPPFTPTGKQWGVWHFRAFTNEAWESNGLVPDMKAGEPYYTWKQYLNARFQ